MTAALMLAAVMPRVVRQTTRRDWFYGAVLGSFLFVAFVTQTVGLQWTTPGKSGFITSLYIVMVPFLYWVVAHRSPGWTQIGGAGLAVAGLGLLSLRGGLGSPVDVHQRAAQLRMFGGRRATVVPCRSRVAARGAALAESLVMSCLQFATHPVACVAEPRYE